MEKKSLHDFMEYSKERFTKRVVFKEGDSTIFVLNFEPGQALPSHKHPGAHVYLLVLQGSGIFTINGEQIHAVKDDVIVCSGEEDMAFTNNGAENASLYVMLNKIPNEQYVQNL